MTTKKNEQAEAPRTGRGALLLAALLGLMAFVLFRFQVVKIERRVTVVLGAVQPVVIATEDILPGREITLRQVRVEDLHAVAVQPGAIGEADRVINRVSRAPVLAGQQVTEQMLYEEAGGYLSFRVGREQDRRAVTLRLDNEGAMAGLITPGDFIDIMAVFESTAAGGAGAQPGSHAMLLVQAVRVLAVDRTMSEFGAGPGPDRASGAGMSYGQGGSLVTVDVSADEAWQLGLASRIAHLRCLLRHRLNTAPHSFDPRVPRRDRIESGDFGASGMTIILMRQTMEDGYGR